MSAASAAPAISDEQLPELLSEADSVELKLPVPESAYYAAAAALGDAQIRRGYFFDIRTSA